MTKPEQQQQQQQQQQRRPAAADDDQHHDRDLELLKAVAQAWHAQSGNPKPIDEFHARRGSSASRPTRFKLEAAAEPRWDFAQSLLDSYEIVTLSKKLEAATFSSSGADDIRTRSSPDPAARPGKRSRESKRGSLMRNLFHKSSSSSPSSSSSKAPDHHNGKKPAREQN